MATIWTKTSNKLKQTSLKNHSKKRHCNHKTLIKFQRSQTPQARLLPKSPSSGLLENLHFLLVDNAAFISGNHIFNIDESILTTSLLEQFQSFLDEFTNITSLSLTVFDLITQVGVLSSE